MLLVLLLFRGMVEAAFLLLSNPFVLPRLFLLGRASLTEIHLSYPPYFLNPHAFATTNTHAEISWPRFPDARLDQPTWLRPRESSRTI